ncbi:MAG: Na/Pi cotransporter family protein [Eubacteriales bacterium]|nr:Na/Pi cotransporter family protein [Lachnospiraceae bacterium]MDO5127177.1 Na/Pi cotransporter family protein [Eubacteriales bacterium]
MGIIALQLMGGLGMFMFGMTFMSHGIEKVAGNKLRAILEAFTRNRFLGLVVGLFFTAVIQSSSAATVMVVSFVNSGLMQLTEACGIILGANIGTTVTAMLVAFRLSTIAPIFVFAGAIMMNFIKKPIVNKSGEIVLGFGVLFVGISTMSAAMAELREIPEVIDLLANFTNPVLGVLLGLVITSVVQSSSVTVSILVVMSAQGLVDLRICMFVILGCNIGACTSAVLAAFGGTKNAKRSALIHLLFNIFGTILMFILLMLFSSQIQDIIRFVSGGGNDPGTLGRNIAWSHFLFKVFQVIVFYPFMDLIIKLTYMLVPGEDKEGSEKNFILQYIGTPNPNPTVAAYLAVQEMERMANMTYENLNLAVKSLFTRKEKDLQQVQDTEEYIDFLDEKISDYLIEINQDTLPIADSKLLSAYFHVVNGIESIGDHAERIAELVPQLKENDITFSDKSEKELSEMMLKINEILELSLAMFVTGDPSQVKKLYELENEIDVLERKLQTKHIQRLNKGKCSAHAGIYFSDIVSVLERISDHATNVALSVIEAKGLSVSR